MKLLALLKEIQIVPHNWNANNLNFEKGKNIRTAIINCLKVNGYTPEFRLAYLLAVKFNYNSHVIGGALRKLLAEPNSGLKRTKARNPITKRLTYIYSYKEPISLNNPDENQ